MTKHLFILLAFCLLVLSSVAQKKYALMGGVFDAQTGEALPAATVFIKELNSGTVTDGKGKFNLRPIKASTYHVQFSFLGYQTQSIVCDEKQLSEGEFMVKLEPSSIGIDDVVVNGNTDGQVKAMLDQKKAENIKNIVSYEQIEQFPDMNSAEVIQRIPGVTLKRDQGEGRYVQLRGTPPELTNFNVNGEQIPSPEGDVRYVGLDVISADQIEFVEVTKVLTSDMDGDGIGGTVNIITKSAKSEKPEFKATIANGYNNLMKSFNNPIIQANYEQKLGKFGVSVNGSYYKNHQGAENMEYKYLKSTFWGDQAEGIENYHLQYREAQLRHYTTTRERIGASATLDYQATENSKFYLRTMFNRFSDEQVRRREIYELDDAVNEYYYLYGGIVHDIKSREKIQNINTINLGGEQKFDALIMNYEVSYALATEAEPDRVEAEFDSPGQAIQMKFDVSDPQWPTIYFPRGSDSVNAYNYNAYDFSEMLFQQTYISDQNLAAKVNFELPYGSTPWNKGVVKFGGKIRTKDKNREVDATLLTNYNSKGYGDIVTEPFPPAPEISLSTFADDFYKNNLLNQGYEMSHMPGDQSLRDYYSTYENFFYKSKTKVLAKSEGLDYHANENIYAIYGMAQHNFNKLMLMAGLRYERTDIDYRGKQILTDDDGDPIDVADTLDSRTHQFILPNIQLKYSVNDNLNIRGALTYTYSRPNFEDVLPSVDIDRDEQKYGNPDLEYPFSTNVDFLIEKYLNSGGLISGGAFYKNIDNFIFYYKRYGPTSDAGKGGSLSRVTKARNGIEAYVYGLELLTQNKLSALPGFLGNFGVFVNYTYTFSDALIYKRIPGNHVTEVITFSDDNTFENKDDVEHISLPGQAEHTANFALFYESKKFYAKVSANYHTAFLDDLGADSDLDEYYDAALHIDFNTYYNVNKHWKIFFDAINITDAPLRYYLGQPDRILKQEYYSWSARVGVKLNY